ncbi:hypothetical protein [Rhodovulum marinum]|nr:hypothetical protein [Rhodovulum marinum]
MSTIFSPPQRFRLSRDMVETIAQNLDCFANDGVVTLEKDAAGVWIVLPQGTKWFLGAADADHPPRRRMRSNVH